MNDTSFLEAVRFSQIVSSRLWDLLRQKRALTQPRGRVFWVKPLADRLLITFDPVQVDLAKVDEQFVHALSTRLAGRRVVKTNSRGLYLQVGYTIPPYVNLTAQPLDLSQQPTPWSMGIGTTANGPLWSELPAGDSYLIGGVRGAGKSGVVHGMIQSLLHGGKTLVYAWDGKDGAEFLRYHGRENFQMLLPNDLQGGLAQIGEEAKRRQAILTQSGCPTVQIYNQSKGFLPLIALVIDEAALVQDQGQLVQFVRLYRAVGIHPIFATNDPSKAGVVVKSNLTTRISMRVVSYNDSLTILSHTGAEKLPSICGRGLIVHNGRMTEFQSFQVAYPDPTPDALAWLTERMHQPAGQVQDPDQERIRGLIADGLSDSAIVRAVYSVTGGARFVTLIAKVQGIRATTTTSKQPLFGENQPESGEVVEVVKQE